MIFKFRRGDLWSPLFSRADNIRPYKGYDNFVGEDTILPQKILMKIAANSMFAALLVFLIFFAHKRYRRTTKYAACLWC